MFILKPKNGIQAAEIEDQVTASISDDGSQEIRVNSGKVRIKTLESGIVNIKNWKDGEGKEIKFKRNPQTNKVDRSIIELIHPELQIELTNAITEKNELTPEELEGLKY